MVENQISDTSRGIHHDPDHKYPSTVAIQLVWVVDGLTYTHTERISADRFFGLGTYGAPIEGSALISIIENMRRAGPPPPELFNSKPEKVRRATRKQKSNAKKRRS